MERALPNRSIPVAPGTGAKRLLGPYAKTTSAGLCLALVAAAFVLAGCGGGSDDGSSTATGSAESSGQTGADAPGSSASAGEAPGGGSSSRGQAGSSGPTSGQGKGSSQGATGGQGAKQGPHIVQPKAPQEQGPTPKEVEEATVADMTLQSPAIVAGNGHLGRLAATYTCDGTNSWPAFSWGGVPAGTTELALFAMNLQPVNEKIFFDWAVAGIDPNLTEIQAGKLPKGAIVGTNSFGKNSYSLCPVGAGETYMFALYALPRSLSLKRGFEPLQVRQEVLDVSGNVGLLPAVYERG